MGAKCCTSEHSAQVDVAAPTVDWAVQVDADDGPPPKPLWLLEQEEAAAEVNTLRLEELAPREADTAAGTCSPRTQQEGEAAGASAKRRAAQIKTAKAKAAPKRAANEGGKADAPSEAGPTKEGSATKESSPAKAASEASTVKPSGAARMSSDGSAKPATKMASDDSGKPASSQKATLGVGSLGYTLRVTIESARGLRNADSIPGKSDPYCVGEIPGKHGSKWKTAVLSDLLHPVWHHTVEITGVTANDSLAFAVWDKDTITADDLLGRVTLGKQDIFPTGFEGELMLTINKDGTGRPMGHLTVVVEVVRSYVVPRDAAPSKVLVKHIHNTIERKLSHVEEAVVRIIAARDLRNADHYPGTGISDPYCICEVPGKPNSKIKTMVAKDTLVPEWNFEATVPNYTHGDPLLFTVMDKDLISSDFLGRASLKADELDGYDGWLRLRHDDNDKTEKAAIRIKITLRKLEVGTAEAREALLTASRNGDAKEVRRLLADGVKLEATNADGFTALHLAVQQRHEDVVTQLLGQKAKRRLMAAKSTEGQDSALHIAAKDDSRAIAVLLVREGANTRAKNSAGKTPADLAKGPLASWLRSEDPAGTIPSWVK